MDEEKELKPFRASERQRPATERPPANLGAGEWRQFPFMQKLVESEQCDPILEKCDSTCKKLDEIIQSGSEQEKTSAQLAMNAYGHSLDLLGELTKMKAEVLGIEPK